MLPFTRDLYLDYPYESARFRYDHATRKLFRRFYGEPETEISLDSTLFHEALSGGTEISREEYESKC